MGLARGYGPAHEPIPESGFTGETNVTIFFVPGVEYFAELQALEAYFLQTTAQLEGIVEFLAVFALSVEPCNKVVTAPFCLSLGAAQSLFFVVSPFAFPVENQSA